MVGELKYSSEDVQPQYFTDFKVIGNGQFGTVYSAIHLSSGVTMAIKKIVCEKSLYDELVTFWRCVLDMSYSRESIGRGFIVDFYGTAFFDVILFFSCFFFVAPKKI